MNNITLVINVAADVRLFNNILIECVNTNSQLPEELADLFNLEVMVGYNENGSNRGVLTAA